jgi:hypothetical protein
LKQTGFFLDLPDLILFRVRKQDARPNFYVSGSSGGGASMCAIANPKSIDCGKSGGTTRLRAPSAIR